MEKALEKVAVQLAVSAMFVTWNVESSEALISDDSSFYSLAAIESVPT